MGEKVPKLYVSAVKRNEISSTNHGGLAIVDLLNWEVCCTLHTVYPMPFCARNGNPRGGTRGWRGITFWKGSLVVANNDSLVFFDKQLEKVKFIISHPSFGNIHSIVAWEDKLFVTSTQSETYAIVSSDFTITVCDLFSKKVLKDLVFPWLAERQREFPVFNPFFDYRTRWMDDVFHLNYVVPVSGGRVLALVNSLNMLIQVEPEVKLLWAPEIKEGMFSTVCPRELCLFNPHDLVEFAPGEVLINSASTHTLYSFCLDKKELTFIWRGDKEDTKWLRGAAIFNGCAYLGTGVGGLLEVDLQTGHLKRRLEVFKSSDHKKEYAVFSVFLEK